MVHFRKFVQKGNEHFQTSVLTTSEIDNSLFFFELWFESGWFSYCLFLIVFMVHFRKFVQKGNEHFQTSVLTTSEIDNSLFARWISVLCFTSELKLFNCIDSLKLKSVCSGWKILNIEIKWEKKKKSFKKSIKKKKREGKS